MSRFDWWDLLSLLGLVVVWFLLTVFRTDMLPIQIWDEVRTSLSAYGMAHGEGWLVPRFEGVPDHWNDKPVLVFWSIAGLMRLGLPLLYAIRLPTFTAALLTLLLLWALGRYELRDRAAGLLAPLLVCTSKLYFGKHVARTGDFDTTLILFVMCQIVAFWMAVRDPGPVRRAWFAAFGAALVLSVMTKGVAGLFAPSGLAVAALVTGRLPKLLRHWQVWAISIAAVGLVLAYYLSRELYDPGYLAAVWRYELGGRMASVDPGFEKPFTFFIPILLRGGGLSVYLFPFAAWSLFGRDERRRFLVIACLLAALCTFLVVSTAQTKLGWYVAPVVPMLSLASAVGLADFAAWLRGRSGGRAARVARWWSPAVLTLVLLGVLAAINQNQRTDIYSEWAVQNGQAYYGAFFDALEREHVRHVTVIDSGVQYQGAPVDYDPMLTLYADVAGEHGMTVDVAHAGAPPPPGDMTATCDYALIPQLLATPGFQVTSRNRWCIAGRLAAAQ